MTSGLVVRLVAAALLVTAVACTGSAGDGPGAAIQVTVYVSGEPEELQAFRDVSAAFDASQDEIAVELVEFAERDDLIARVATSLSGGEGPDVFLINYRYLGQFASRDVLLPLDDRLAASETIRPEDFYPEAMDAFRWNGAQVCVPQNISSLVLYYNRDLLREAGVPLPDTGWNWHQMVRAAQRLTVSSPGGDVERWGLGVDPEIIRLAPFVWSNGGEVVDDTEDPTRFTLDAPEAVQALQSFFNLRQLDQVVPTDEELEAEDNESRFLNGRMALMLESRKVVPSFRTITDFDWDVAPLPRFREPVSILHSDGYCLPATGDEAAAAWRFTEFAVGPGGQRIAAATGRTVPSLQAVARSEVFLDPDAEPANSQVFLDAIPTIRRVPSVSTWPEIEDAANALLEEGMFQGVAAEEVGREIVRRTKPLFARAEI